MGIDEKLSKIVGELIKGVGSMSNSETIVGEPQKAGDATIIPVHRLKVAFGVGSTKAGAHHKGTGGDWGGEGAGGAVELDPVAAIAIGKDGSARLLTVDSDDTSATWSNLLRDVPEVMRKIATAVGERAAERLKANSEGHALVEGEGTAQALPEKTAGDKS